AIWRESLHLAAVCHVLARRCTRLNADQALLAGLLHGLGRLYIVMRAEDSDDFTLFHPDVDIRDVASGWQAAIGKAILDKWGLPEAIQHAVEHQDDFDAELEGPESLTDVLIAAKALAPVDAELDPAACPAVRRL